jgi:hypothetical protein
MYSAFALQRRREELRGELLTRIDDERLDRTAVEAALPDLVEVVDALSDVDRERDDVDAAVLLQPADRDGRVESAGVGEDDGGLAHGCSCRAWSEFGRSESRVDAVRPLRGIGGAARRRRRRRVVPLGDDGEDGVVPADRAEDGGTARGVERRRDRLAQAGGVRRTSRLPETATLSTKRASTSSSTSGGAVGTSGGSPTR